MVIHVDGPYMAHQEFNWVKLAIRAGVVLILSPILVSFAAMWFARSDVASSFCIDKK